jgi:ABC-type multidrug transport system fused ATPase/permease subunit
MEARQSLTMAIGEAALDGRRRETLLPAEQADAAVFDGRVAGTKVVVMLLPALVSEPIAALLLFYFVKPMGVTVLAGTAALGSAAVVLVLVKNLTSRRVKAAWQRYMKVAESALTSIRAATELVASGHEREHLAQLRADALDWTRSAARAERNAALFQRVPLAGLVVLGAVLLVQTRSVDLNEVLRLAVFLPPLAGLANALFELLRSAPQIQTLGPVLDARWAPPAPTAGRAPPALPCEIRFESVGFAYDGAPALTNVSFVWKPGQVLGLRGRNGSGKSTLLKLLLGLLEPTAGRIVVGGVDLRDIDLPAWRRNIAYLSQRPYVPDKFTVYESMRLVLPMLTESEARDALRRSGALDRIARASAAKGEELEVSVGTLSAGVRQLVLLSRAVARPAGMLLLDEPDENLDVEARRWVLELAHGPSDRMMAVATHEPTLLASVDAVLDLATGAD